MEQKKTAPKQPLLNGGIFQEISDYFYDIVDKKQKILFKNKQTNLSIKTLVIYNKQDLFVFEMNEPCSF